MATKRSISIYISTGCPWGNDKDVNEIGEKPGGPLTTSMGLKTG